MPSRFKTINIYPRIAANTDRRFANTFARSISIAAIILVSVVGAKTSFAEDTVKEPTVCMIPLTNSSVQSRAIIKQAQKDAKSQRAKLRVYNEKDHRSQDDQFATFKDATKGDCDAIILEPHGPSSVAAEFAKSINTTIKNGTPVVAMRGFIKNAEFTSQVSIGGQSIGDHLARQACKRVKSGDTVFHVFPHYHNATIEVIEKSALKEFNFQVKNQCPGVNFISIEAQYPRDVLPAVISKFQEYGSPALILTDHPKATLQSLYAIEQYYKDQPHDIKLVGFGSSSFLFKAMQQDKVDAIVVPDHNQFSGQAIIAAVLAANQKVKMGMVSVPLREMTKKNFKEFEGYHSSDY